jgi:stress-induced morphogen
MPVVEGENRMPGRGEALGEGIEALLAHTGEAGGHDHARDGARAIRRAVEPGGALVIADSKANLLALHRSMLDRADHPAHRIAAMAPNLVELKGMIEEALPGAVVEVFDEDGGGQHLKAVVSAAQFEGLSRIDQHRLVKAAVKERFDDGTIHALSVKTDVPS